MRRVAAFFIAGAVVLIVAFCTAFLILPSASLCHSISCGSGELQASDYYGLTWPQAVAIMLGVVAGLPLIVLGWIELVRRSA
jgi:hypothetical protein